MLGTTLWAYAEVHVWAQDAIDYLPNKPSYWIPGEGRWLHYWLFPLLKTIDGSIALFPNLLFVFLFAFIVARRYARDTAYALAFAALCTEASPWTHQLMWPSTTLPSTAMLMVAALTVRALPVGSFYVLFGSLFSGTLQHLYFVLPLLHLPLLAKTTLRENARTLAVRIVPAWVVGALTGYLVMLAVVYGYTQLTGGVIS